MGAEETRKIFDRPLYKRRIQPVWLKIENLRQTPITFLPVALDPDYYTPLEVANYGTADKTPADALINEFFLEQINQCTDKDVSKCDKKENFKYGHNQYNVILASSYKS